MIGLVSYLVIVMVFLVNELLIVDFMFACSQFFCSFDGLLLSDLDGTIIMYSWDFGDGMYASGMIGSYSYVVVGMYFVLLLVIDDVGVVGLVM